MFDAVATAAGMVVVTLACVWPLARPAYARASTGGRCAVALGASALVLAPALSWYLGCIGHRQLAALDQQAQQALVAAPPPSAETFAALARQARLLLGREDDDATADRIRYVLAVAEQRLGNWQVAAALFDTLLQRQHPARTIFEAAAAHQLARQPPDMDRLAPIAHRGALLYPESHALMLVQARVYEAQEQWRAAYDLYAQRLAQASDTQTQFLYLQKMSTLRYQITPALAWTKVAVHNLCQHHASATNREMFVEIRAVAGPDAPLARAPLAVAPVATVLAVDDRLVEGYDLGFAAWQQVAVVAEAQIGDSRVRSAAAVPVAGAIVDLYLCATAGGATP